MSFFSLIRLSQKQPPELFYKKCILRNFPKFTGKHLFQSLFFNNVAGLTPATLLKKRLWHRCFPVNFGKFLKTLFLAEYFRWLLSFVQFLLDSLTKHIFSLTMLPYFPRNARG